MKNKVVFITGSTDGIGKQTALVLAQKGARVLLHGKNESKGLKVREEIIKQTKNTKIDLFIADLSSMNQVNKLAENIKSKYHYLDVLINNAGVFMKKRIVTEDGFETTFAVNYLSHFLLTNLLLDIIKINPHSRIINIASMVHQTTEIDFTNLDGEKHFNGKKAYALSKLANIIFTYKLAENYKGKSLTVNCLHPGVIDTKLLRSGFGINGSNIKSGAKVPVYMATSAKFNEVTGAFYVKRSFLPFIIKFHSAPITYNKEVWEKLWKVSSDLVIGISNV